jgi:hypothetical protein
MRMLRRIAGMLRHAGATLDEIKGERLRSSLLYLLVLLLPVTGVLLVLSLIVVPVFIFPQLGDREYMGFVGIGLMVPLVLTGGFFVVLLAGLLLHPFVCLLGGRQGLRRTMQAAIYGSTPLVLSVWFPPAMAATPVWSSVLTGIGLRRLQELTTARAVTAIVLPLLLLFGLGLAAGLVFW